MNDLDDLMQRLAQSGPTEVEEMRRIGRQPGATCLDLDGRVRVVKPLYLLSVEDPDEKSIVAHRPHIEGRRATGDLGAADLARAVRGLGWPA